MALTNPYRLGRTGVEHDPRSRGFVAQMAPALTTVGHRHWGPVLDQGNLGSCTGNAMAQALNTTPLRHGRPLNDEYDAVDLYIGATNFDNVPGHYPPDDTGSTGLAVAKEAQRLGYITSYRHAFGLDQTLHAAVLQPVLIGINWYNDMFTPNAVGYIQPGGDLAGGHELVIIGLSTKYRRVTLLNSWGSGWGLRGKAYMTWSDLDRLLREEGDCTVPVV